jgi:Methyltransferase domain
MQHQINYLGTLRSLYGDDPQRFAGIVGCALGLRGRRASLDTATATELRSFLLYFLGIDRMRLGAAAALAMHLNERQQSEAATLVAGLDREARLSGLAGAAFALAAGSTAEFSAALKSIAAAFELEEQDIVEAARLLEAGGHGFEVCEEARHDYGTLEHASFRAGERDVEVAWRPYAICEETVAGYFPFEEEHMTARESLPITPALRQLSERFPWPERCPSNPFDRRGWFSELHMQAFLRLLPREPALILEVGSFLGASLRFMMEIRPGSFFIAMDPFRMAREQKNGLHVYDFRNNFYTNCWNYRDRLVAIPQRSPEAFPVLQELGVRPDVVYIDGLHNYGAVMNDARWSLALNPRVLLIGDDYSDPESIACGVRDAVAEIARKTGRELEVVGGHVWVLPPRS